MGLVSRRIGRMIKQACQCSLNSLTRLRDAEEAPPPLHPNQGGIADLCSVLGGGLMLEMVVKHWDTLYDAESGMLVQVTQQSNVPKPAHAPAEESS